MQQFILIPALLLQACLVGALAGCSEEAQEAPREQEQTVVVPKLDWEANKRAADKHIKHNQDLLHPNVLSTRFGPDGTTDGTAEPIPMDDTAWDPPKTRTYGDSGEVLVETYSRWATSDQEKWFEAQIALRYFCTDERWNPTAEVNYLSPDDTVQDGLWHEFSFLMKVDDGKPQNLRGQYIHGGSNIFMDEGYDSFFLDEIREGKSLAFRISYNSVGKNIFRWDLKGLQEILDGMPAMCPAGN